VTFNGSAAQNIHVAQGGLTFYDLTINNTAASPSDDVDVDAQSPITVTHTLSVNDGQFSPQACSSFANVSISANGILKPHAATTGCNTGLQVSGNWTDSGGAFDPNGSTVTFNGTTPQTVSGEDGFGNVTFNNAAGVAVTAPFAANGLLDIENGNVTLPDGAQLHDVTIGADGNITLSNTPSPATITVTGDWQDETTHGGLDAQNGTVTFAGNGDQTFSGTTVFHNINVEDGSNLVLDEGANLGFSGNFNVADGGTFTLGGADQNTTITIVHVDGSPEPHQLPGDSITVDNLVIGDGATLSGDGQTITVVGDYTNDGTFTGGNGTVIFDGPDGSTQHIQGDGTSNFNNLDISGAVSGDAPANVTGTLTVDEGGNYHPGSGSTVHDVVISNGATLDGSGTTLNVTGDWTQSGTGTFVSGGEEHPGTVVFNGTEDQTITGSPTFQNITVDKDSSAGNEENTLTVTDPLTVDGELVVSEGEFVQVQSGSSFNSITVEDGGQIIAENNATDINVNEFHFSDPDSFVAPGGQFKPSNILWSDDTRTHSVVEKPAGTLVGLLKTIDLNQETQDQFTYQLSNTANCGPDNSFFELRSAENGQTAVYTAQPLDYETKASYTLCVQSTDPTHLSTAKSLTVTPVDANDEPVITEDAADGQTDQVITINLDEDDTDPFTLHASDEDQKPEWGSLRWSMVQQPTKGTITLPDTLTVGDLQLSYQANTQNWNGQDTFTLGLTDGQVTQSVQVHLNVNAVNDPPINMVAPVIPSEQAYIGQKVQATSGQWNDNNDPEHPGSISVTYQWQRADDDQGTNLVNISGATQSAYTPTAADQGRYIRVLVTAHDNGTGTPASASTDQASSWASVPGAAPVGVTLTHSTVAEKQPVGTIVGYFNSEDSDAGDTFTYVLVDGDGGQDNASFTIDGNKLLTNAVFDYSQKTDYSIRVKVTDGGGNTYETSLALQVVGTQAELQPKTGTQVTYPGTEQTPGDTQIDIPVGAVLDPITLIFTPLDNVNTPPSGMTSINHGFDLTAVLNGEEVKDFEFNKPVTFTVTYPDSSVRNVKESSLKLMVRNGDQWEDATCGSAQLDPQTNTMKVPVCKLGEFGIFGSTDHTIYLPIVIR
jgi:hypothetical protein